MKSYRLPVLLIVLLCLITGAALAQDEPPLVVESPQPFYDPPALELHTCTDDTEATEICDRVATSPEDIVGVWSVYFQAEPMFIRFNADGTWMIADTVEGTDEVSVEGFPFGTYSFDEEGIFNNTDLSPDPIPEQCANNNRYVIRVIKMGEQPVALNPVALDDCFAPRRTDWAYTMLWISE